MGTRKVRLWEPVRKFSEPEGGTFTRNQGLRSMGLIIIGASVQYDVLGVGGVDEVEREREKKMGDEEWRS